MTSHKPPLFLVSRWVLLSRKKFAAVTRPPFGIYISKAWWEEASWPRRIMLLRHEQEHWNQYQRMGLVRFYLTYTALLIRYGYKNNPMEVEARKAALGQSHEQ